MAKRGIPTPTPAELAILVVLWEQGPVIVPKIWEALKNRRGIGYTTVLKQLQVMEEKGFVIADKTRRPFLYRAVASEDRTQRRLVRDLIDAAFGGSFQKLVMKGLADQRPSRDELKQIRKLLDDWERKR